MTAVLFLPVCLFVLQQWQVEPDWLRFQWVGSVSDSSRGLSEITDAYSVQPQFSEITQVAIEPSAASEKASPGDDAALAATLAVLHEQKSQEEKSAAVEISNRSAETEFALLFETFGLVVWLTGASVCLAISFMGAVSLHRFGKQSRAVTNQSLLSLLEELCHRVGIRQEVMLLQSDQSAMPMTWGFSRPKLLIPKEFSVWNRERQIVVLMHELAHVRRWDYSAQWLARLACAIHWYNPLVWYAARQMEKERETACDDVVLNEGFRSSAYAEHLLRIASRMKTGRIADRVATAMARHGKMKVRLEAILDPCRNRRKPARFTLVISTVVLTLLTLSLAILQVSNTVAQDQLPRSVEGNGQSTEVENLTDPLPDGAVSRLGTARLRHRNEVKLARFSPNGKILASAGRDASIRLWDVATGRQIRELGDFGRWEIYGLVFSPDGKKMASVHQKGIVRLWNVTTGKLLCKPQTHPGEAYEKYAIAFSPNGKQLATVGGIEVRLWSADDLEPLKRYPTSLPKAPRGKPAVAFSPDGKLLAANGEGTVFLWTLAEDEQAERIESPHKNGTSALVFTPDSHTLVTGGQGSSRSLRIGNRGGGTMAEIKLWDAKTRRQIGSLETNSFDSGLYSLALSRDGTMLASGHHSEARIWDLNSNTLHSIIQDHYSVFGGYPCDLDISHDGKKLAARSNGNTVGIWDIDSGDLIAGTPETHQRAINTIGIANGGETIITGADHGSVHFWETATGAHVGHFASSEQSASIAASPAGNSIAIGGGLRLLKDGGTVYSGTIQILDLERLEEVPKAKFSDVISSMAYSQDGRVIAAATNNDPFQRSGELNEAILVVDATTGKTLKRLGKQKSVVAAIGISADRKTLYSVHRNSTLLQWDLIEDKLKQTTNITGHKRKFLSHVAFTADSKRVVTCEMFGTSLVVTDVASGKQIRTINVPNTLGNTIAISPEGRLLASACQPITSTDTSFDEKIHLWEIDTGKELMAFDASSDGTVASLAFLPDGKTLVSGMNRGTALLWDVAKVQQ